MPDNGSSNGHSVARERLEPIVRGMRPDLRSSVDLVRAAAHVYYNIRYVGVDRRLVAVFEGLKREGVPCATVFDALCAIYEDLGLAARDLLILQDLIPDHLLGPKGSVIWIAERPSPPPWHCRRAYTDPETPDDEDGSP